MTTPLLEVRDLVKHYPGVHAVDGVSFTIEAGRCFGILGPNGAGKTTTLEIIEGIHEPDSGAILYRGLPRDARFREEVGIQFQQTALQQYLTVHETLRLFRGLYPRGRALDELIALCRLEGFLERDANRLSGGQRQRLLLAMALVNDPALIFLDEPTTGLDPQARRNFWELVAAIRAGGTTIVLTTHYMEEAQVLCDELVIMDHGRIIAEGTPEALLSHHFDDAVLELPEADFTVAAETFPLPVYRCNGRIELQCSDIDHAVATLQAAGISLARLRIRPRTLEDLFLKLTGRELRQ